MKNYEYTLGFIGAGNMAKAIAGGIIRRNIIKEEDILMCDVNPDIKVGNIKITTDCEYVLTHCKYVILSVKPQIFPEICSKLATAECKCFISIMAGVSSSTIRKYVAEGTGVIRVMPNTPCAVGKGMVVIAQNDAGSDANNFACDIFNTTGQTVLLPESDFDAVTSVSGSGPAYVYYFIRAMIRGGIDNGLSEDASKQLVLATFDGATQMVRESSDSLDVLIDKVCSKGGTTIQAVNCFDNNNADSVIREGMHRCFERSKELNKA